MREGGHLSGKCAGTSGFCICPLALNLMFGGKIGNLGVFMTEHGLEMQLAKVHLVRYHFAPDLESGRKESA
jgi:hypothetical protein